MATAASTPGLKRVSHTLSSAAPVGLVDVCGRLEGGVPAGAENDGNTSLQTIEKGAVVCEAAAAAAVAVAVCETTSCLPPCRTCMPA